MIISKVFSELADIYLNPFGGLQLNNKDNHNSKLKCSIMLHPSWKEELPESFSIVVRSDHFVDCTSYEIGNIYIEIEALEQNLQMGIVKLLMPHRLVSAVVLSDSPRIIGFAPLEPDTEI